MHIVLSFVIVVIDRPTECGKKMPMTMKCSWYSEIFRLVMNREKCDELRAAELTQLKGGEEELKR